MKIKNLRVKSIFLVGIGGISMSAIAKWLKFLGVNVEGSDRKRSKITKDLEKRNIKVYYKHRRSNIKNADLVVYSGAVKEDNKELMEAKKRGIKSLERSKFLGLIIKNYKNTICVAGTHGKTTTSSMISLMLINAGLNPTIHIGGESKILGGNLKIGGEDYLVLEACEFRNSFLEFFPTISVVTNVEEEHMDYFKNRENLLFSFNKFVSQSKKAFINGEYKKDFTGDAFYFNDKSGINAKNIEETCGKYSFDAYYKKRLLGRINLNVCGKHNIYNALATLCVGRELKIDFETIKKSLEDFQNVDRRFEIISVSPLAIHDYAHHPTEIKTVIECAIESFNKKIICIFEPHTYSRTKLLFDKFLNCFSNVEEVVILKTYSAREKYDYMGSSERLKKELEFFTKTAGVFNYIRAKSYIKKKMKEGDYLYLFLGAGDIVNLANYFRK